MEEFRRTIIKLADILAIIGIVFVTLWAAAYGAEMGKYTSGGSGMGLLFGAAIGFIVSAMSAALWFALSEIASNTRPAVAQSNAAASSHHSLSKWQVLKDCDAEIAAAVSRVRPLGARYEGMLEEAYLLLQDKSYLPAIEAKIFAKHAADKEAVAIADQGLSEERKDSRRMAELTKEFGEVFVFRGTYGYIFANSKWQYVVMTTEGPMFFRDGGEYYARFKERLDYPEIKDAKEKSDLIEAHKTEIAELNSKW